MMLNRFLIKTNISICAIILVGMLIVSTINYHTTAEMSKEYIEQVTVLTSEAIYNHIRTDFMKAINISLTMANDTLFSGLIEMEQRNPDNEVYIESITEYLAAYKKKYQYDSVFLASTKTNRFYDHNGIARDLSDRQLDSWYYRFLEENIEYNVEIDTDKTIEEMTKTVFINCRINNDDGEIIGVAGVGFKTADMQQLLIDYETKFKTAPLLIDRDGKIVISLDTTSLEEVDFFEARNCTELRDEILNNSEEYRPFWQKSEKSYISAQYISELSWYLIIEYNADLFNLQMKGELRKTGIVAVILLVMLISVISFVIKWYNNKIIELTVSREKEQQAAFRLATEQLYENINEMNITKNCAAGRRTRRYFESLGMQGDIPFDEALQVIAEKQIAEEFREGYLSTFNTKNVLEKFEKGISNLFYEFMISLDGLQYVWIRIDAYVYYSPEDDCVHMFAYRKNIDESKSRELQMSKKVELDGMTMVYNKISTERRVKEILMNRFEDDYYALFVIDIDNFKQVNDRYGHAFGDLVIVEFASVIKSNFRRGDIIGRIGGDEFLVFVPVKSKEVVRKKVVRLSKSLDMVCSEKLLQCKITASIGVAVIPQDGNEYEVLFKKADSALYNTKKHGKNGFSFYQPINYDEL